MRYVTLRRFSRRRKQFRRKTYHVLKIMAAIHGLSRFDDAKNHRKTARDNLAARRKHSRKPAAAPKNAGKQFLIASAVFAGSSETDSPAARHAGQRCTHSRPRGPTFRHSGQGFRARGPRTGQSSATCQHVCHRLPKKRITLREERAREPFGPLHSPRETLVHGYAVRSRRPRRSFSDLSRGIATTVTERTLRSIGDLRFRASREVLNSSAIDRGDGDWV